MKSAFEAGFLDRVAQNVLRRAGRSVTSLGLPTGLDAFTGLLSLSFACPLPYLIALQAFRAMRQIPEGPSPSKRIKLESVADETEDPLIVGAGLLALLLSSDRGRRRRAVRQLGFAIKGRQRATAHS